MARTAAGGTMRMWRGFSLGHMASSSLRVRCNLLSNGMEKQLSHNGAVPGLA